MEWLYRGWIEALQAVQRLCRGYVVAIQRLCINPMQIVEAMQWLFRGCVLRLCRGYVVAIQRLCRGCCYWPLQSISPESRTTHIHPHSIFPLDTSFITWLPHTHTHTGKYCTIILCRSEGNNYTKHISTIVALQYCGNSNVCQNLWTLFKYPVIGSPHEVSMLFQYADCQHQDQQQYADCRNVVVRQ